MEAQPTGADARATLTSAEVDHWATRFALLGVPSRLALLSEMHACPGQTVAQLAERVGITENAASQSLRALRTAGWVDSDRTGRTVRYSLVHDAVVHQILHDVVGVRHTH